MSHVTSETTRERPRQVGFAVESWAPEYGSSVDGSDELTPTSGSVDLDVEVAAADWRPIGPDGVAPARDVLFIDGVRRMDARVWLQFEDGSSAQGLCVSYGAGAVRCNGRAEVVDARIERGVFAPRGALAIDLAGGGYDVRVVASDATEQLVGAVQQRMGELEIAVAQDAADVDLVVVDGPLSGRQNIPGAIGYVKTHRVAYLPAEVERIVRDLAPGERTPVFVTSTSWSRYSWYARLPHGTGHPWAGVVRCEASGDLPRPEAIHLADVSIATLPRFASEPHKDGRAPQNLYPIAGLEQRLRHLLGSVDVLVRRLRRAAA